jgi:hypothetical protein
VKVQGLVYETEVNPTLLVGGGRGEANDWAHQREGPRSMQRDKVSIPGLKGASCRLPRGLCMRQPAWNDPLEVCCRCWEIPMLGMRCCSLNSLRLEVHECSAAVIRQVQAEGCLRFSPSGTPPALLPCNEATQSSDDPQHCRPMHC